MSTIMNSLKQNALCLNTSSATPAPVFIASTGRSFFTVRCTMPKITKKCTKCLVEQPLSSFSLDRTKKGGQTCWCKSCVSIKRKRYYKTERGKERLRINVDNWQRKYPLKRKANNKLYHAVKYGRIEKPKACSLYGDSSGRIDGHHPDYSKPFEVVWCCRACHCKIHADKRPEGAYEAN